MISNSPLLRSSKDSKSIAQIKEMFQVIHAPKSRDRPTQTLAPIMGSFMSEQGIDSHA